MMKLKCFLVLFFIFAVNPLYAAEEIKQPNVAGAFYPSDPRALTKMIDDFFAKASSQKIEGEVLAIISPHAGYEFSGGVAAYGFKAIKDLKFSTVIVIAPSHYADFKGSSIWLSGAFKTPLGEIPVDSQLGAKIVIENENIRFLPLAFQKEHSLEVQLPFLQSIFKEIKIVPIIMGALDLEDCRILADALVRAVGIRKDVLIVASSDMSHYHGYNEAVTIDKRTLKFLENFDILGLWKAGIKREVELCGLSPVVTALLYSKARGANAVRIIKYANSGDVTQDYSKVVGYASALIYKPETPKGEKKMLSDIQKKKILEIARESLESYVKSRKRLNFTCADAELNQNRGAFVTLTEKQELRGCIGRIVADSPLCSVIADMAIEASSNDPRFYAVKPDELREIEIEISVLSPIEKISDINQIEVGSHGLIIRKGPNSGLLLPQVATEYGWDRLTFLEQTCHKAGLPKDAWKTGAEISIFSAEVFSEKSVNQ